MKLLIWGCTCVSAAVVHVRDGLPGVVLCAVALDGLADERPVVPAHRVQRVAQHAHTRAGPTGRHVAHLQRKENTLEK